MRTLFATHAMLPDGWARAVRVSIGEDGRICAVARGASAQADDRVLRDCALLPAIANVHSHAFQRAMAGSAERWTGRRDNFWRWRKAMYRFLTRLTPDDVEAIAAWAYMEMLEAGFGAVGEFHYLHHGPDGRPYDSLPEMAVRIIAAARESGIGLCLLPALYGRGEGGDREGTGNPAQRRFHCTLDTYLDLYRMAQKAIEEEAEDFAIHAAPHSLRAVSPGELYALREALPGTRTHIHVAEQRREVFGVRRRLGARPVEWVARACALDESWCLIHATHMTRQESALAAASGAVAGLCPITEANLGDGIFDGRAWRKQGGGFAVGTDSNICISLNQELRQLEYSQRLRYRARAVFADETCPSVGETLYLGALDGGAQALGRKSGRIAAGFWADLLALDLRQGDLRGAPVEEVLDRWILARAEGAVRDVWSAGRHSVQEGRHVARARIEANYRRVLRRLGREAP